MKNGDKNDLLNSLDESFTSLQTILDGVDLELRVYPDPSGELETFLGTSPTGIVR